MIRVQQHPQGGFVCQCTLCGQGARVADPYMFKKRHLCRALGAGDLVAKATSAVGIKPCKPCEERKERLNGWFPAVWRR